jgi:hypothetical protein
MMTPPPSHMLTLRQATGRVIAGVALGAVIAAAIATYGSSASAAKGDLAPTGTAASQLSVLRDGPVAQSPPADISAGLDSGKADTTAVRLLGSNVDGLGVDLYASARPNGGACNALSSPKGGVATTCVDDLPASGISVNATDSAGWLLFGFAADGVVGVDVVVGDKALPATMLRNAYVANLGALDPGKATALVVHRADGTSVTVVNDLRAPGS